ncbi:MAG: THUMP domain-containing protein [Methanotrichaceae archaeon]
MKLYAFHLSGEHETLPRSEAIALLEICSAKFKEISYMDQCLLAEAEDIDAKALELRLGMTHSVIEVLAVCDASFDALAEAVRDVELSKKTYRIRAKRIKHTDLKADQIEREVGKRLLGMGYKADLKNPEIDLKALITEEKIVFGIEIACPDRSGFEDRRPHLKPFFHPGVLMPRIARALVNIVQAQPGERLLDSFVGTGGILVEACLIGICGIGVDVQRSLIRGASSNITGLNCSLVLGDAKRLPFRDDSIDSAVLDIPYGRSALIRAKSKDELLKESIAELNRVLKPDKKMAIVADRPIDGYLKDAGFNIIEIHRERVHRSLTRHIFICKKQRCY